MRVLFLSHSSGLENMGGAELALLDVIDRWRTQDPEVDITVVARGPAGMLQPRLAERSVPCVTLDFDAWVLPVLRVEPRDIVDVTRRNSAAVTALVSLMQDLRPDVVITNTIISPWAALAAKILGLVHLWWVHEYGDLDHGLRFEIGRDRALEDIGILSDHVIVNSLAVREHLARWIPRESMTVVYPIDDFEDVRRKAELVPSAPSGTREATSPLRVVMVGRLSRSKGQWRLVEAMALLREEGLRIDAVLVGDATSEEAAALRKRIDGVGLLDQVKLRGESDNPFPHVLGADLGVTASDQEAFGRVTAEYMALGKAVIVADSGAGPELVRDGVNGWHFEAGDVGSLAAALRAAAHDRDEVRRRGMAARRFIDEEFGGRHTLRIALQTIREVVDGGPRPMPRLPNITRIWLDYPSAVDALGGALHGRRIDVQSSRTWRLGRLLLAPARYGRAFLRGASARLSRRRTIGEDAGDVD